MKSPALPLSLLFAVLAGTGVTATAQEKETQPAPSISSAKPALPEGLPDEFGVYLKTEHGWERLHQNRANKTEIKRGAFTQWTGIGVGGLHQKMEFSGSQAQLQTVQSRPSFYVRVADANRVQDMVIVQFRQSKNKRQIETAEISGERTGGGETRSKANICTVTVRRLAPEVFVVTPESDLTPGEYILSDSAYAKEGYDFGISGQALLSKQ